MATTNNRKPVGFPSPYVPNSVKNSEDYAKQMFGAILDATATYRTNRKAQITNSRMYARGKQPLQQYLDELKIEGDNMYINISYDPTKVISKFEKIVVDDYQQLKETPKAVGTSYHLQERKERNKANLKFRMEYDPYIKGLEQEVGFAVEDPNVKVPQDEEELDLITSLNADEREELLLTEMIKKVFKDNDLESKKRQFLSDIFQVNFGAYRHYTDRRNKIRIDFIPAEDVIYSSSSLENFQDISYAGSFSTATISELRDQFDISEEKEIELYKLAFAFKNEYGNYSLLEERFNYDWRRLANRPYDDFTVPVYHIWKRTVKNVGYLEGEDSYGKKIFDIDKDINKSELKPNNNKKRTGVVYPETSYEGWFAGNIGCSIVLEWGESFNQVREGKNKESVLCPYIFFMPDNRGTMMEESAVEKVIPEIRMLDLASLKIKTTLANHPPVGYAVNMDALMDIDLGYGELQPLSLDQIAQQTGKYYYKLKGEDGAVNGLPITPLNISIMDTINTYLVIYNNAMNNIRDTLGINTNREGTASINRASNSAIQTQIAISQTATYYIYRAFLKATELLTKHIGIRILDVLTFGSPNKGYLQYLGESNIDFINEREEITASNYDFYFNPQMTKQDEEYLVNMVNAGLTSRQLEIPDALFIMGLKNIDLAQKYMKYLFKKNKENEHNRALEMQQNQIQGQESMAVNVEREKQNTIQIQSQLQAQEWKIKGEATTEQAIYNMVGKILEAQLGGTVLTPQMEQLLMTTLDNAQTKQEKSMYSTEQELEQQAQAEQQNEVLQQLEQRVQSGELSPEEAQMQLEQMQMGV